MMILRDLDNRERGRFKSKAEAAEAGTPAPGWTLHRETPTTGTVAWVWRAGAWHPVRTARKIGPRAWSVT